MIKVDIKLKGVTTLTENKKKIVVAAAVAAGLVVAGIVVKAIHSAAAIGHELNFDEM